MHKHKEFIFIDRENKEVKFTSKRYTFKLEDYLLEKIGKEKWDAFKLSGKMEFEFTPDDCKEDFPRLLEGDLSSIDFTDQDIAELSSVYFFFINFRTNVTAEQQKRLNEIIASNIMSQMKILNSIPQNILEQLKDKTT